MLIHLPTDYYKYKRFFQ